MNKLAPPNQLNEKSLPTQIKRLPTQIQDWRIKVTLSLVGVCLASLSGLTGLAAMCWIVSRSSLLSCFSSHLSGALICRYIRSLHAMVHPTSLSSFSRASWVSQFPRGWWVHAFSPLFACTAVSSCFRHLKAEGCRGFHDLDGSRSNSVSFRHSCGEAM